MENKHTLFHRTDYMKMFCESLGEHARTIWWNVSVYLIIKIIQTSLMEN